MTDARAVRAAYEERCVNKRTVVVFDLCFCLPLEEKKYFRVRLLPTLEKPAQQD